MKRVPLTGTSGTGKSSVIEALPRTAADYEIRATMPLSDVVTAVLRLTGA